MAERYERVRREMLQLYGIRVRKYRTSMSGAAWEVHYRDGTITRLIEAPRPVGPMSAAVFLHEIGHHALGLHRYRTRLEEEFYAWAWSLNAMHTTGLNVTEAVRRRMRLSMEYALSKAERRGLRQIPAEIADYFRAVPLPARRRAPAASR